MPLSVRESGTAPWRLEVKAGALACELAAVSVLEAAAAGEGNVAIMVPAALVGDLGGAVTAVLQAGTNGHRASDAGPDSTGPDIFFFSPPPPPPLNLRRAGRSGLGRRSRRVARTWTTRWWC